VTAKTFFGNFFIVIGGFFAVFSGGCGVIFEIIALTHESGSGENYLGDPIAPLVIGGVPAFFGIMLFLLGRWLKKRAAAKETSA
jgi:hypothetical protein